MSETNKPVSMEEMQAQPLPTHAPSPTQAVLDFESDAPLVCSRDQTGDTTCEACQ